MKCCKSCIFHPCPAERRNLNGSGSGLICWLLLFWCLIVTAGVMFVLPARADDWKTIQQAAWDAYHRQVEFDPLGDESCEPFRHSGTRNAVAWAARPRDGTVDCEDHAKRAYCRLYRAGIPAVFRTCQRKGEGHVYLMLPVGMAIDNSSPYPMSVAEVGCD